MDLQFKGRRALVTGSSSGIGEAIARMLAEEGAAVVVHGRNRERAEKVAADINAAGVAIGELSSDEAAAVHGGARRARRARARRTRPRRARPRRPGPARSGGP